MRRSLLAAAALSGFAIAVLPALADDREITTSGTSFVPDSVTIKPGDRVIISQESSSLAHNVHWDDRPVADQPLTTGSFRSERTFDSPGTFRFYCDLHGGRGGTGMSGTVIVREGDDTTGTTGTTTSTTPTTTETTTTPSEDTVAPDLSARRAGRRGRVRLRLTLSEEARIRAVVRRGRRFRRVVSFTLADGTSARLLLPRARRGRYRIKLTATDAAGNRSAPVRLRLRVK